MSGMQCRTMPYADFVRHMLVVIAQVPPPPPPQQRAVRIGSYEVGKPSPMFVEGSFWDGIGRSQLLSCGKIIRTAYSYSLSLMSYAPVAILRTIHSEPGSRWLSLPSTLLSIVAHT